MGVLARKRGGRERGKRTHRLQAWALDSESLRIGLGSERRHTDQTHTELNGLPIRVLGQMPSLTLQPPFPPLKIVRIALAPPSYMNMMRVTFSLKAIMKVKDCIL